MLEMIDKGFCSKAHPVPLLFIHGAWHAAWCWDQFLGFFADRGYRAAALSLRGHGASPTAKPLRSNRIADYVDDVGVAADKLGGQPVLIGHSLGGFIVQKYLEDHPASAAVLLGSVPPHGTLGQASRLFRRHPWVTIQAISSRKSVKFIGTPALAREHLFSPHTPDAIIESCMARIQPESIDTAADLWSCRVKTRKIVTPMLVLGAEDDGFVNNADVRATARAYRTEAEFFPAWATT